MTAARSAGFSLFEVLLALGVTLVLLTATGRWLYGSLAGYGRNMTLTQEQNHLRLAIRLLASDIRQAGSGGCAWQPDDLATLLATHPSRPAWLDWPADVFSVAGNDPLVHYGDKLRRQRSGTDALRLLAIDGAPIAVHAVSAHELHLEGTQTRLHDGDFALICAPDGPVATRLGGVQATASGTTVQHQAAGSFNAAHTLVKIRPRIWYIGYNDAQGLSLYRQDRSFSETRREEIVRGVGALQLSYHEADGDGFVGAEEQPDWPRVDALRLALAPEPGPRTSRAQTAPTPTVFSSVVIRRRVP